MAGTATGNAIQGASGGAVLANPVTIAQGGTGQTTANAGFAALSPLTTQGDLIIENATPVPARLAVGTAGAQMLGVSSGQPAWVTALCLQATTGTTPYTLVNGTGNILTWTTPNDGALHRVVVMTNLVVSSTETGGAIGINALISPNGSSHSPGLYAGAQGAGLFQVNNAYFVEANQTVTLAQTSALTGGAAVLWAEIWGS